MVIVHLLISASATMAEEPEEWNLPPGTWTVGPTNPMCLDDADVWENQFDCEHPPWGQDGLPKVPIGEPLKNLDSYRFDDLSCDFSREKKEWGLFWDDNPIDT